jgi:putative membrane protein
MMYWGNHMSTGGWIFSILGTVIIVALIIAAVVWLASDRSAGPEASAESAGEILDRRLASGEVTPEQYNELRETLGASAPLDRRPPSPVGTAG